MTRYLLVILLLFSGASGGLHRQYGECVVWQRDLVRAEWNREVETTGTPVVACDTVLNLLTNDSVALTYTSASIFANSRATLKRTDNAAITDVIPTRLCAASAVAVAAKCRSVMPIPEREHAARAAGVEALQHSALFPYGAGGRNVSPGRIRCC